jgi:oligopeptidase A
MARPLRHLTLSALAVTTSAFVARVPLPAGVLRGGALHLSSAVAENPLLEQTGLPRFDAIDASHVKPGVMGTLEKLEAEFSDLEEKLASTDSPAYADVVEAMETIEAPVEFTWGVVGHLMGVKNSDELRAAHGEMQPEVIKATTKMSQSAAVFSALEAVSNSGGESLDPAQKRIVDASIKAMRLSGVALEGEQKETFNKNRMEVRRRL